VTRASLNVEAARGPTEFEIKLRDAFASGALDHLRNGRMDRGHELRAIADKIHTALDTDAPF